ncbi:hypothetical protein ACPPVO_13155 [Dactylosporangium sp. McL0621]
MKHTATHAAPAIRLTWRIALAAVLATALAAGLITTIISAAT